MQCFPLKIICLILDLFSICDKMNVCCLSHPDRAALSWKSQKTHTMTQEHFWVMVSCILLFYLRTGTLSYMKPQNFQFFYNTKNTNVVISYMCLSKKKSSDAHFSSFLFHIGTSGNVSANIQNSSSVLSCKWPQGASQNREYPRLRRSTRRLEPFCFQSVSVWNEDYFLLELILSLPDCVTDAMIPWSETELQKVSFGSFLWWFGGWLQLPV